MNTEVLGKSCKTSKKFWCMCTDFFVCPHCNEKVFVKVYWKPGANFRTSICSSCGVHLCLQFNDDSCERCRSRKPNCLLKVHLRVRVLKPNLHSVYGQIAHGFVGMKYLEYMKP